MFNKKYKEEIKRLSGLYKVKCGECEELREKVDTMKKDNADLAFELRGAKMHIEALSVICSAIIDVMNEEDRSKAKKIIDDKATKKRPGRPKKVDIKVKQPKKGKKNAKKAK